MRKITFQTEAGNLELQISEQLVEIISKRELVSPEAVDDDMIIRFVNLASSTALDRAVTEYVMSNDTNT